MYLTVAERAQLRRVRIGYTPHPTRAIPPEHDRPHHPPELPCPPPRTPPKVIDTRVLTLPSAMPYDRRIG